MTKNQILERIQNVVREQLDDDDIVLSLSTVANAVEGWDSLAHVRIIIAVEEEFGVQFHTSDIISLHNVGDLVDLVEARL
jgi:acyl carrier protein